MGQALTSTAHHGPQVLLVDSNIERSRHLREHLSSWGFAVTVAHDGYSGLRQIMSTWPELIVVDSDLKGWSSSVVIDGAVRLGSRAPVVMLSEPGQGMASRSSRRRVIGVVENPNSVSELRAVMMNALAKVSSDGQGADSFDLN
ncbi:response regulator [Oleomonas cavernae]|uniref:Response regulator n=1 Tax=Oleomonas cavernae TaxID=2320859 RepID=A0A418WFP2_9PROT|nr:response regulator [Oleomonas cavernae]